MRCVRLWDLDPLAVSDDGVLWRPIRDALGIGAFGVNAFTAQAADDEIVLEHAETAPTCGGQVELYVVLSGSARFVIDGTRIDASSWTMLVVDPWERRRAHALEAGTTILAIGASPAAEFRVSVWEFLLRSTAHYRRGELAAAKEAVRNGLEAHPGSPDLLYNLACCENLAGHSERAVELLRQCIAGDPAFGELASSDPDLATLRGHPDFPNAPRVELGS